MHSSLQQLAERLSSLSGGREVVAQLHTALGPVLEYDARTKSDLAATLRVYVETGSLAATAERLFLHRNSVLYRLQRIEELSGIDLKERRTRLVLLVALAITDPTILSELPAGAKAGEQAGGFETRRYGVGRYEEAR